MRLKQKPLRIWTSVWGDTYIDWFEKACLSSLSWPRNAAALEGATWVFLTKAENIDRLKLAIKNSGIKVADIEFLTLGPEFDRNPHAAGQFLKEGFVIEMGRCLNFGARLLIAPPDTLFSEGSIEHLLAVSEQRDSVVFAAHVRAHPEALAELSAPSPGPRMVAAAWRHLHKTWVDAEVGLAQNNSYIGGVSWRYLSEGLYAVTHRLPTPYLINFVPEDLVYFKNQIHFGILDHAWASECLINEQRQRYVGSSDAAFMIELTDKDNNIPPVEHYRAEEPDAFWRNALHNRINRLFTCILRAE